MKTVTITLPKKVTGRPLFDNLGRWFITFGFSLMFPSDQYELVVKRELV